MTIGSQLFEEGYDVWFANMRGSRRSREHINQDPDNRFDFYWSYSLTEMADYDIRAMIYRIRYEEDAGCKKVTIVAHSLGAMTTIISLSRAKYAQDYISQVVLMEPCIVAAVDKFYSLNNLEYFVLSWLLWKLNIESLFGPNWRRQRSMLCEIMGWFSYNCDELYMINIHDENDEEKWFGT